MQELENAPELLCSLNTIEMAFDQYGAQGAAIAFNGGKDSVLLLHLVSLVFKKRYPQQKLVALYFDLEHTFPEIVDLCHEVAKDYDLEVIVKHNFISGLSELKQEHQEIKAIFMGTRFGDPHSASLQPFQPTDPGWPEFMRVSPILNWEYTDVWKYLLHYKLKYCKLYDEGYTSIGQKHNTKPNPALEYQDDQGNTCFLPAYTLLNGAKERDGRTK